MQTTNPTKSPPTTDDAIALAAYLDWVNAGKPFGRDQEFWLRAEAKVRNAAVAAKQSAPPPKAAAKKGKAPAKSKR
jgi:hypothetical protein